MFSHLCRACFSEFKDSSEVVPLFEPHKNIWYYRLLNTSFRLSVSEYFNQISKLLANNCSTKISVDEKREFGNKHLQGLCD